MKSQVEALGNPLPPHTHTPESKQKSLFFGDGRRGTTEISDTNKDLKKQE